MPRAPSTPPTVWIVDSEQWARALLRAELIERGCEAVGYVDIPAALAALRTRQGLAPELIVLELRGQRIEALGELGAAGIPIVILGGSVELNEPAVRGRKWAAVLRRPFTIGAVADTVERLLGRSETRAP